MKFSSKDFFSKCDQIRRKLRDLVKNSLMENFIFCAVFVTVVLQNVSWLYPYTDMSTLTKRISHLMLT